MNATADTVTHDLQHRSWSVHPLPLLGPEGKMAGCLFPNPGLASDTPMSIVLTYRLAESDGNGHVTNPGDSKAPSLEVTMAAIEDYVVRVAHSRNQAGIATSRVLSVPGRGNLAVVNLPSPPKPPDAALRYPYPEDVVRRELDRKLALIETLDYPRWDGYEAVPLDRESMADARRFLGARPSDVPLPFAQIGSDGIVGFYWDTKDMHVSVDFDGNGLLSYFTRQGKLGENPVKQYGDDVPITNTWPTEVTDVLRSL